MSNELSGRDLEIAVAKALGYEEAPILHMTENHSYHRIALRRRINCKWVYLNKTIRRTLRTSDVWVHSTPRYLTDPSAFAEVLAALANELAWTIRGGIDGYSASVRTDTAYFWSGGSTYQEAMCQAFVAWKRNHD